MGVVAVLGLGIYAVLLYGAILLFGVTLTLPGFAGLILTIGVAADANVVVFERIKEEVRSGKSVRAAIGAGYAKGFHTILDANAVTCITALVLFAVATAGVKGFALMLLIGTVISLLTAVAATRAMLGLLAGFKWFDNPTFMGAHGNQGMKFLHIDYMGKRRLWFAISGTILLVSLVSLGVKGLNLGIDFKGGTQISFTTPTPKPITNVRNEMAAIGRGDAVVQGRGAVFGSESYKSYQVRSKSLQQNELVQLQRDLGNKVDAQAFNIKNVSSSFGRQIAKDAILAILFSLFLVVLYVAIRFDLKFALPVIAAHGARRAHLRRRLLGDGPGGDDVDGRRSAHRARLLDLRHDHHLRPNPREHSIDAARAVRDDREHLAVGDDPPLAGDDVHHAAADPRAVLLRRSDAEGLRVRARGRRHLGCLLLDLLRSSAPDDLEGARAGVRAEARGGACVRRRRSRRGRAGRLRASARRRAGASLAGRRDAACDRRRRRQARAPQAAAPLEATWPRQITATKLATPLEQLLLAGVGVVALTADRMEELIDSLTKRGLVQRDEARAAVEDTVSRWRGDATRVTERAGSSMHGVLREFGLVLRSEYEELELRVAQLEHRLKLVERREDATPPPA